MIRSRLPIDRGRLFVLLVLVVLGACASPEEKAQSFMEKGEALLKEEKYVEASLEFRNALKLNEDLAPAWLGLAKIEQQNQKWRPALGALRRVIELDPKNAEAHTDISRIMLLGGNLEEALKYNNTAFELTPDAIQTLNTRAVILLKLGDTKRALDHAGAVLEKEPGNPEALLVLASERLQAGDTDGAMAFVEKGLDADPADVGVLIFKIRILEQDGKREAAKDVLLQLVDYYPEEPAYRKSLVNYYIAAGNLDLAEKEIRAIAVHAPDNEEAQFDIVRFLATHRGFEAARDELGKMIEARGNPVPFELMLAQLQFREGRKSDAESGLKALVQREAGNENALTAKVLLARILLQDDREDEARALVEEVLETDKNNVDALSIRANLAVSDGEFESAINDLRAALNEQPNSPALKAQLGRALELNGSVDLADENFALAMRESDFAVRFGVEYSRFLRRQGRIERAEEVMNEMIGRTRPDADALTELATIKLQRQDWRGAEKIGESLQALDADSGTVSQILGVALSGQNRFDESIAILSSAQAENPNDPGRLLALVRSYLQSGRNAEAEAFLDEMLQTNADNVEARILLGVVKSNDPERLDEAEAEFRRAIEVDAEAAAGYRALIGLYIRQGRYQDAAAAAQAGLAKLPDNVALGMLLAGIHETTGEYDQAIALYERLYDLQPESQVLANNLASLLADHRDDEASLDRAFHLASRLKSSEVAYFKDTLAWVHFRRGDTAVALDLLQDAAKELPNLPIVHYHLGQVLLKEGRQGEAKQEFEKALELDAAGTMPFRSAAESALAKLGGQ